MSTAVIRQAHPADAQRLAILMREFYLQERFPYGPGPAAALSRLLLEPPLGRAWNFESREEDVGYLGLTGGYSLEIGGRFGLIDELYVREAHRGAGLGTRALQAPAAAREAAARAVGRDVDRANLHAAELYRRAGFSAHDRHFMTLRLDG